MKLKKGDKIVCIDVDETNDMGIELYETYTIDSYVDLGADSKIKMKPFVVLKELSGVFVLERFITFQEYRKQKLNKILKNNI